MYETTASKKEILKTKRHGYDEEPASLKRQIRDQLSWRSTDYIKF